MRALLLCEGGGVRLSQIADAPDPGPGEIRVATRLTPVNPADHLALEGTHLNDVYGLKIPMGAEGLAVVESVGKGVKGLAIGDRVLPLDRGNWVERRTLPAERVLRAPDSLADEPAAIFRINPPTAHRLLSRVPLSAGDWIIVNGAGSMIGRLLSTMGRARGLNVICVLRTPEKARKCLLGLGASAVISDGETIVEQALSIMGGPQAKLALDCVTGVATGRLAQCLAPGGRVTVFGHLDDEPCSIPSTLLTSKDIIVDGYSLRPDEGEQGRSALQSRYEPLASIYTDFPTVLPELVRYPVDDFQAAIAYRGPQRALLDWTE